MQNQGNTKVKSEEERRKERWKKGTKGKNQRRKGRNEEGVKQEKDKGQKAKQTRGKENVVAFRCLGTTLTNQHFIHENLRAD